MNKMCIMIVLVCSARTAPLSAVDAGHKKIAQSALRVKIAAGLILKGAHESFSAVEHAALQKNLKGQAQNPQKKASRVLVSNIILGQS